MGLTVNHQTLEKVTVNRQLKQALAVKRLKCRLSRTIIASNNDVKCAIRSYIPK